MGRMDLEKRLHALENSRFRVLTQDMMGMTDAQADAQVQQWEREGRFDDKRDLLVRIRRFAMQGGEVVRA